MHACEDDAGMLRCWDASMRTAMQAAARAAGATVHGDELCIDTAPRESYTLGEDVKCNYIIVSSR